MVRTIPISSLVCLSIITSVFAKEVAAENKASGKGGANQSLESARREMKARVVKISMADGMRFEPPRLSAKPGESLLFKLENLDSSHQPHNFLVVAPGMIEDVVKQGLALGEKGALAGFIPQHPSVLASTGKVLDPESGCELAFAVPKEPGVYGYVCTVPGHGMLMYGALYVGVPMPPLAKDSNVPQITMEKALAGGGRRPFVQRMFLPNSGPAAIGVALPGAQNICFDAGECRLRYAWRGPFIDATLYWQGNGDELADLSAEPWWVSSGFPLKIGGSGLGPVKFLGYRLVEGLPEFHYRAGDHEIYETVVAQGDGIELRMQIPTANSAVSYEIEPGEYSWQCAQGKSNGKQIVVAAPEAKRFSIVLQPRVESVKKTKK
jgi:plastocyanin